MSFQPEHFAVWTEIPVSDMSRAIQYYETVLQTKLKLTERESEVLYWIGNGKTNREIGQILDNSPRTINKHLEQVFRKLEVSNRTSAAAIAIRALED